MSSKNIITLDCGLLCLVFRRVRDRWEHAICLREPETPLPVAHSIEGQPDDPWPVSPVLQEVHVEERTESSVAFLTGMAGGSHWSASILCHPARHEAAFDIACRCKQPPAWLGSGYQLAEGATVRHSMRLAEFSLPHTGQRVVVRSSDQIGPEPSLAVEPGTRASSALAERIKGLRQTLFVSPVSFAAGTLRWEYEFSASEFASNQGR